MTTYNDIIGAGNYYNTKTYLDHGFVSLTDHMGSDESIEFATRMSYGAGTRKISDRRNLLRYLVRHQHTSPIEMGEVVFHLKVPIFVMRQLVRHRTASLNEYSARYSVLTDEFYVPTLNRLKYQSTTNKQGSGTNMPPEVQESCQRDMVDSYDRSMYDYKGLIDENLSRELARIVMPVGGYTELVWKSDLKNFFHMIKLRMDPHAQEEIRELAELMYDLVKPLYPLLCEAFEDYWLKAATLSRFEILAIRNLLKNANYSIEDLKQHIALAGQDSELSQREKDEFVNRFA